MSRRTVRLAAALALAFVFAGLPASALGPGNLRQERAPDGWMFPSALRFLESAWSWAFGLAMPGGLGSAKPSSSVTENVGLSTDPNG